MWRRFRRYLPFGIGGQPRREEYGDEDDGEEEEEEYPEDGREETSVDAPPGLFSDEEGEESGGGFSSARSSFRRAMESPEERRSRRRRERTASASQGQQSTQHSPPRGKFLKRSETAPRSERRSESTSKRPSSAVSARAERRKQSGGKRPASATPHSEGGDAPRSEATDNLTSRLSRRSSIISDLVALMVRRSSSMGHRGSGGGQQQRGGGDEEQQGQGERRRLEEEDVEEDEEGDHDEDMGNMPREKILERIRHHKEIIGKVRLQPWPMRRKRRALKVARQYLQRQEAQVSKWGLYKVEALRRGNQAWRWVKNLSIYLIPWESKIKQIESNFGSVVSSYFIFLRWVLGMNVANSLIIMAFVVVPEWLADTQHDPGRFNRTRHIKVMPAKVAVHADELNSVLDFGGYLQYSYLFYGYYSHETVLRGLLIIAYNVPVAYVFVNLFLLVFCIFIILKKMTTNTRKSKLSSGKQEQYVFTWKAVNGWDYNIGEAETAASLAMANAIKLKEASTEYKKKFKQKLTFQKLFIRFLVNLVIFFLMGLSMVAIYKVGQITEKDTFIKQNAVSITVAAITLLFPPIFELILKLEQYRPRTALRIHLFRVLFFYLLNYFTLVYSLFVMLNTLEAEMRANVMWQKEQQFLASQIRPYQYQFHIVHSPGAMGGGGGANQSYYEVVSSPVSSSSSSSSDGEGAPQLERLVRSRRPFSLFASVRSAERRRDKRQLMAQKRGRLGPKRRRKRPSRVGGGNNGRKNGGGGGDGAGGGPSRKEERDLNVLYSSQPFPGHEPASTTAGPETTTRPWTTVQPHFGPIILGLYNPQAFVLPGGRSRQPELGTVWESRPVGATGDWAGGTEAPMPLNYTSAPKIAAIPQPYRASNYDDLCWETLIGQEIAKIVTTDLVMTVAAIMVIDFLRGLWIRYCSDWWCWDIEATFPEYGEFKVAENVLHLVNSQAMVCLGTILVPMLPLINCVKLVVVMYIRAWACMVCNVPAKQIFRASRSSNFYFWLLLAFVCMSTLPVGFVIAYKQPSKNCGPFAGQESFYSIIGHVLEQNLPQSIVQVIAYFKSPGIIFPVFLLLVLIIYFLVLLVNGLRAANSDLNKQLTLERTEEKRKIFELAKGKRQSNAGISHKSRPSGESKKSSGGSGNGGNGSGESYETAATNGGGRKGSRLSPLYFLNGGSKSGLRKSWHGGPTDTGAGNGHGEKGDGEPEGILLNPLFPLPRKLPKDDSAGGGAHSPSKSPLRHATFLPSLQSVDEKLDEEEDMEAEGNNTGEEEAEHGHAEAMIARRKRSSADEQHQALLLPWLESATRRPSAQQSSSADSSAGGGARRGSSLRQQRQSTPAPPPQPPHHRPSLRFSWKDRLLICIGWTDPAKLELKLRRQMEEAEMERGGGGGDGGNGEPLLKWAGEKEEESMGQRAAVEEPVLLEEADYSVPSDEQGEEEEEEDKSSSKGETVLAMGGAGGVTPRVASRLSQATSGGSSQQPMSLIYNRLSELAEEDRPPSSGASSSAGTGSQRSWVRQQPATVAIGSPSLMPTTVHHHPPRHNAAPASPAPPSFLKGPSPHPLLVPKRGTSPFPMEVGGQITPTMTSRRSSVNGAMEPPKRAFIEREHVSESSPLSQRRHSPFPAEELARLSPDKRHPPMSPRGAAGLPPAGPKGERGPMSPLAERQSQGGGGGRRPSRESAGSGAGIRQRMDVSGSGSSSLGTRPPSDDLSLLLEEPSTPIGYFRPISAENVLGQSFASSTGSDTRLQYANPYSSYAAAMCSPILPTDPGEQPEEFAIPSPTILSLVPPPLVPSSSIMPFLQPAFQRRPPPSSPYHQLLPSSSSPTTTISMIGPPPLPRHGLGQTAEMAVGWHRESPIASGHGYATPTPTMERRRRSSIGRPPERIYDQPLDQRRPSGAGITGDEGGSTSGRGTMPPGYGSSASAGSSPEFGRPKYKISSMSPSSSHLRQGGGGQESSGSSPAGSPQRRFEIRQRSGLGLGRPLRMGSQNGKNGGNGGGHQRKGEEEHRKREETAKTPPGEKQSTV